MSGRKRKAVELDKTQPTIDNYFKQPRLDDDDEVEWIPSSEQKLLQYFETPKKQSGNQKCKMCKALNEQEFELSQEPAFNSRKDCNCSVHTQAGSLKGCIIKQDHNHEADTRAFVGPAFYSKGIHDSLVSALSQAEACLSLKELLLRWSALFGVDNNNEFGSVYLKLQAGDEKPLNRYPYFGKTENLFERYTTHKTRCQKSVPEEFFVIGSKLSRKSSSTLESTCISLFDIQRLRNDSLCSNRSYVHLSSLPEGVSFDQLRQIASSIIASVFREIELGLKPVTAPSQLKELSPAKAEDSVDFDFDRIYKKRPQLSKDEVWDYYCAASTRFI